MIRPKNVVVVGGGSGIGLATVKKLLEESTIQNVIIASRNVIKLNQLVAELNDNRVSAMKLDISEVNKHNKFILDVNEMIDGKVDGVIISSGLDFDGSNWKGFNISEEDYDRIMNTNLKGVFFFIRNYANYMSNNSIKGNICVVSSISAHRDLLSVYQITKNALSGIVHAYGKHLCEKGIVLNCVEPGTTDGGMLKYLAGYTDGVREGKTWNDNSIRRVIRPSEIAEIICFLISDIGEVMSGTCLLAGGGCKTISR